VKAWRVSPVVEALQALRGVQCTVAGTLARRVLVDGAWAYRSPAKVRRHWQLRLEHHPKAIQDLSWKAPVRLCQRYRRLVARGNHPHVGTVAMARALAGFMWAMATEVPVIA
jgi:transposase